MPIVSSTATRTDVCAECRHDMQPSVRLPGVSGVDSKFDHRTGPDYAILRRFGIVLRHVDFFTSVDLAFDL